MMESSSDDGRRGQARARGARRAPAAMIVRSPRLLGDSRPFSGRPENLGQAGCLGPPRFALGLFLPVSPTMSGVRWSMRSWESVRPRRSRRQGVPRSHGPAEESVNGRKVNFPLMASMRDHPIRAPGAQRRKATATRATLVRCLILHSRRGRAAPPRHRSTRAPRVRCLTTRGPGAQPRTQPLNPATWVPPAELRQPAPTFDE
jgi:hypothetical protein